jgi:arylamine N-acetyltransferase
VRVTSQRGHLPSDVVDRYLNRLGLERERPSAEALSRLHERHVELVPYETLWIQEGEDWSTNPETSARRIAMTNRGGYCFHLNGALASLLAALGYDVTLHVGGVHGPEGPTPAAMTSHLVLIVHGLPTEHAPDGDWYVDVGLGDALHHPLPLAPATVTQGPFTVVLDRIEPTGAGDWHLAHDPAGAFVGMSFLAEPTGIETFDVRHDQLSTSPESPFVRMLTAHRRDADSVDTLRNLVHTRVTATGVVSVDLDRRADWLAVLHDVFGLTPHRDPDGMWSRLAHAHEVWVATGRP